MELIWNIPHQDRSTEVKLLYNVYLGIKKLYVDGNLVISSKKLDFSKYLTFHHKGKEYKMELYSQGYGCAGEILTPEGETIASEKAVTGLTRVPVWILPFLVFDLAIPVIALEAVTAWGIGIAACCITVRLFKNPYISKKARFKRALITSLAAWVAYCIYYIILNKFMGVNAMLIPFI